MKGPENPAPVVDREERIRALERELAGRWRVERDPTLRGGRLDDIGRARKRFIEGQEGRSSATERQMAGTGS